MMLVLAPLTLADTPLLRRWLAEREARRWLTHHAESWAQACAEHRGFLVLAHDEPVGAMDVEFAAEDMAYLTFVVAASARGRGLGRRMIDALRAERPDINRLCGLVAEGNRASTRCLRAAGFTRDPFYDEPGFEAYVWRRQESSSITGSRSEPFQK